MNVEQKDSIAKRTITRKPLQKERTRTQKGHQCKTITDAKRSCKETSLDGAVSSPRCVFAPGGFTSSRFAPFHINVTYRGFSKD